MPQNPSPPSDELHRAAEESVSAPRPERPDSSASGTGASFATASSAAEEAPAQAAPASPAASRTFSMVSLSLAGRPL